MTERYVPDHVPQGDGSACEWTDCWAACGSFLADGASGGETTPDPTRFRKLAMKPSCLPGGLADIERGLRAMGLWWRCRMTNDMPRATLRRKLLLRSGLLYAIETDFESWPEATVCQPDFNDREDAYHGIVVVAGQGKGPNTGRVRVMNPLCTTLRWVDVDEVIEAAVIYNAEHGERRGTVDVIACTPPRE